MTIRLALAFLAVLAPAAAAVACSSSDTPVAKGSSSGEDGGAVIGTGDNATGGSGCLYSDDNGNPATCSIIRINGQSTVQSQADCQGGTFVTACPTAALLGCCSKAGGSGGGATNEEENCDYQGFPNTVDGGLETTEEIQNFCAEDGVTGVPGRFSATP